MQLGIGLGLNRLGGRGPSFSPLDIADLAIWLDASDTSTITESGGAVSQWDDKSGNGRNATQATAALQWTTGAATLNGLNALTNDGGDIIVAPTPTLANGATLTAFVAWEYTSTTSEPGALIRSPSSGMFGGVYQSGSGGATSQYLTVSSLRNNGANVTNTRGALFTAVTSVANVSMTSGTLASQPSSTTSIIPSGYSDASFIAAQKLGEFLFYTRILTADEIGQVEAYLAGKWGVTLA